MKNLIFTIFLVLIVAPVYSQVALTNSDLEYLDRELQKAKKYDATKLRRIDSLKIKYKKIPNTNSDILKFALKLGKEYESFISDSAFVYYQNALTIAKQNNDVTGGLEARIALAKALSVSGLFNESVTELASVKNDGVPESLKGKFYDAARQIYYYMMVYAGNSKEYTDLYFKKNREYRDSLRTRLNPNDPLAKFYYAEMLQDQGKLAMSRDVLNNLLKELPTNSPIGARAQSYLASLSTLADNPSGAAHYWVLSAISDIQSSIKENSSLQQLALYLYSKGDIERAYRYISISMDDANFCNARMRNMQIAKNMPLINSAYKSQIDNKKKRLTGALIIVSILTIGLVIAVIMIMSQIRKLKVARLSLKQANSVKEEYMGHFLDLCSIYMKRLDSFNKTVMRKVSTGQIDDLLKLTKSPKFAEEQNKLFYENFDSAFLHIYPTFVEDFNALLLPEEQIEIKEIGKLTMELRIFAFLRLGIDDSNKIASFLHYSVNTIYTYRNKIRNKAINRATFDKDIMEIGYPKEN